MKSLRKIIACLYPSYSGLQTDTVRYPSKKLIRWVYTDSNLSLRSISADLLPVSLLLILIVVFFFRLFYPELSIFMIPDFGESDVLNYNLPLKNFLARSLQNNVWPLWTYQLGNGFPLLAEGQIGTFYLPNLLLFKFLPFIFAFNLSYALSYVFLALGSYFFLKKFKFSPPAALLGSIIFTFSGFFSVHINHLNVLQAISLTPFLYLTAFTLWQHPRLKYVILLSFILTQQLFAGYITILYVSLIGLLLFLFLYQMIIKGGLKDRNLPKRSLFLILSFLYSLFLGAIQLLPTLELVKQSSHQGGLDFYNATFFPYPVKHLLAFLNPYFFGSPGIGTYPQFSQDWGIFWENTAYIGVIPLFLALLALFYYRIKLVRIFSIILIVSLLLVFGKYSPLYFIFAMPPFNFFRVPSRYLLLTLFSLTGLATYLIDKILLNLRSRGKLGLQYSFFFLVFFYILFDTFRFSYQYPPVSPASDWMTKPKTVEFLQGQDAGKIVTLGSSYQWNKVFLTLGWQDLKPYRFFANNLYPNYNLLFDLGQFDITSGLFPRRMTSYTGITKNAVFDNENNTVGITANIKNSLRLAGVSYVISPYAVKDPDLKEIYRLDPPADITTDPIRIYQLNDALADFYLSNQSILVTTLEEFYQKLEDKDFISGNKVLVEDPDLTKVAPSFKSINPQIYSSRITNLQTRVQLTVEAPGILVWNDNNYPGWQAFDNDKPAAISSVNLTFKGVALSPGRHEVVFKFIPKSFTLGKTISVFAGFTIYLILFLDRVYFLRKASRTRKPSQNL